MNEGLNDEFDLFKQKGISYQDDALRMGRSIDLFNFWIRESNVSVQSLQAHENENISWYVMIGKRRDVICQESNLLLANIVITVTHPL